MSVQASISNLATLTAGAIGVGKKLAIDKKQAEIAKSKVAEQQADKARAEKVAKEKKKQEALDIATEVDVQRFGVRPEDARAYALQSRLTGGKMGSGTLKDLKGNLVATYSEMAEILADKSLKDTLTSQARASSRYRERLMGLGHSYDERVKNALIASGGK